jgi:hypothetical protein
MGCRRKVLPGPRDRPPGVGDQQADFVFLLAASNAGALKIQHVVAIGCRSRAAPSAVALRPWVGEGARNEVAHIPPFRREWIAA